VDAPRLETGQQIVILEREARNLKNFLYGVTPDSMAQMVVLAEKKKQYALMHCIAILGQAYRYVSRYTFPEELLDFKKYLSAGDAEAVTALQDLIDTRGAFVHQITYNFRLSEIVNYTTVLCRLNSRLVVYALKMHWDTYGAEPGGYMPSMIRDTLQFANRYPNPMEIFTFAMAVFNQPDGLGERIFKTIAKHYIENLDISTVNIPEKMEMIPHYRHFHKLFVSEVQQIDTINSYVFYARSVLEIMNLFSLDYDSNFAKLFPEVCTYFSHSNELADMAVARNDVFASFIIISLRNRLQQLINAEIKKKSEKWLTDGWNLIRKISKADVLAMPAGADKENAIKALGDEISAFYNKWTDKVPKIIENVHKLQKLIGITEEEAPVVELISLDAGLEIEHKTFQDMQKQLSNIARGSTGEMVAQLGGAGTIPSSQPQPQSQSQPSLGTPPSRKRIRLSPETSSLHKEGDAVSNQDEQAKEKGGAIHS
jgi:hypothetical protein